MSQDAWVQTPPSTIPFCFFLLVVLILFVQEQADIVVSRKPESAFAVAMVAVNVAKSHPALMDLLIGQLYNICPYAVPYYLPRYLYGLSDPILPVLTFVQTARDVGSRLRNHGIKVQKEAQQP
jgi:hypothetical protein